MKDIATIISFTMELPYLFASLKTIHNWHVKVEDHHIVGFLGRLVFLQGDKTRSDLTK
jgi:hypothetical protein